MPKRYQGNTGRYAWVENPPPARRPEPPRPQPPPGGRPPVGRPPAPGPSGLPGLGLPKLPWELETEDLILLLLCYLLYRESGDSDWLIALGALLLS